MTSFVSKNIASRLIASRKITLLCVSMYNGSRKDTDNEKEMELNFQSINQKVESGKKLTLYQIFIEKHRLFAILIIWINMTISQ